MTNLRGLDLNLMTVFEAVFESGSISGAAERLSLSPSATSHAVTRLREACSDDLFVRIGQGIAPTPVAQRIFPEVKTALEGLRRALAEARGFDPAASTRRFTVAIPHPMGPLWALALGRRLEAEAPAVRLVVETRTLPIDPYDRMRSGELDLAVDWVPAAGERFVNRRLYDETLVFVARANHPAVHTPPGEAELRRLHFVRPTPRHAPHADGVRAAREVTERLGLDWRLDLSEFLEVPFVAMTTDLVGYLPASLARTAIATGLLGAVVMPFEMPRIPIHCVWHEARRGDDGHRWLREVVAEVVLANQDITT
jgi:DNA-binding transcriptional LysR family regulator